MLLLKSLFVSFILFFLSCTIALRIVKKIVDQEKERAFINNYEPNVDFNVTWDYESPFTQVEKIQKQLRKKAYIFSTLIAIISGIIAFMIFLPG